jgi:hypothetical protein
VTAAAAGRLVGRFIALLGALGMLAFDTWTRMLSSEPRNAA